MSDFIHSKYGRQVELRIAVLEFVGVLGGGSPLEMVKKDNWEVIGVHSKISNVDLSYLSYFKILWSVFLALIFFSVFHIREPREHPIEAVQLCKLLKSTVFLKIKKYGNPYLHTVQSLLRSTEYFYISFMWIFKLRIWWP